MKKLIALFSLFLFSCGTQTEPQPTQPIEIETGINTDTMYEQGVLIDTSQANQLDSCESYSFSE